MTPRPEKRDDAHLAKFLEERDRPRARVDPSGLRRTRAESRAFRAYGNGACGAFADGHADASATYGHKNAPAASGDDDAHTPVAYPCAADGSAYA